MVGREIQRRGRKQDEKENYEKKIKGGKYIRTIKYSKEQKLQQNDNYRTDECYKKQIKEERNILQNDKIKIQQRQELQQKLKYRTDEMLQKVDKREGRKNTIAQYNTEKARATT